MYGVYIILIFLPFNIFYRSARYWFLEVLVRALSAPFLPVKFKDFFIANQFTSLTQFLYTIQFAACIYPATQDPNSKNG